MRNSEDSLLTRIVGRFLYWLSAWAGILERLVFIVSLTLIHPRWELDVLIFSINMGERMERTGRKL